MLKLLGSMFPPYTGILWLVSVVHFAQGLMLLADPDTVFVTSTYGLSRHVGPELLGILYVSFASLAIFGIVISVGSSILHAALWLPQQLLVMMAAFGSIEAVSLQQYLDGVGSPESGIVISRAHLFADQWVYIVMAVAHVISFFLWRSYIEYTEYLRKDYEARLGHY